MSIRDSPTPAISLQFCSVDDCSSRAYASVQRKGVDRSRGRFFIEMVPYDSRCLDVFVGPCGLSEPHNSLGVVIDKSSALQQRLRWICTLGIERSVTHNKRTVESSFSPATSISALACCCRAAHFTRSRHSLSWPLRESGVPNRKNKEHSACSRPPRPHRQNLIALLRRPSVLR